MPKGRMLNRSISRSEKVAKLSIQAALFFSWCIPHLDREGRIYADINTLKGTVAPYLDYMTHEIIEECKAELAEAGLVLIYGEGKYMQFLGFSHNQTIRPDREKPSEIPAPTTEETQSPELLRSYSGDKIKTKIKDKININKPENSPALQAALDKIYSNGFNIFALITKLKKHLGMPAEMQFPEEVLLHICEAYWREKAEIRNPWPWFITVLSREYASYNAQQNIQEHDSIKKSGLSQDSEIMRLIASVAQKELVEAG